MSKQLTKGIGDASRADHDDVEHCSACGELLTVQGVCPSCERAPKLKGGRGSRSAVDLFGAIDEAGELMGDASSGALVRTLLSNLLKSAAGRAITCPVSGRILDYRTCVVVTFCRVSDDSTVRVFVLDPGAWAELGERLTTAADEDGYRVKVLTLRHVNARLRAAGLGVVR